MATLSKIPASEPDPSQPTHKFKVSSSKEPLPTLPKPNRRLKVIFSILVFILIVIGLALLPPILYLRTFATAANTSPSVLLATFRSGLMTLPRSDQGLTSILILGTDKISGQRDNSLLTDTILIVSLNHQTRTVHLISIPRDLWIDAFKTKVNAIYYYGEISPETTGVEFAKSVLTQITGLPIHYTYVTNLSFLERLVDTIGGVTINVPESFTDENFPRSDVDITNTANPELLYETVTFNQGSNHMDGSTALKYIRSRNSSNLDQGNDTARSQRQQQLIAAIVDKLTTSQVLLDPHVTGELYKIYLEQNTDLRPVDLIGLTRSIRPSPTIAPSSLPIKDSNQPGLIFHPSLDKYDQWVYEPLDPSWREIHSFIDKLTRD